MTLPRLPLPPVWLTIALAAIVQAWSWPLVTTDMSGFLLPWFDHIARTGPIAAFAEPFANYSPPYLYLLAATTLADPLASATTLIKLLSLAGAGLLAIAMWRLLTALDVERPERKAALALLLPTVAINAGILSQADSFWAAASLMVLESAVRRRHRAMLGWFGLAVAIKAQALFLGPFVLALLIARRVDWRLWALGPVATLAAFVPAALAGWPVVDLLTVYFHQADTFSDLSRNAPNLWAILQGPAAAANIPLTALAATMAVGGAAFYIAHFSVRLRGASDAVILRAALLAPLIVAGTLPRMHERFFFLADLLALILALLQPKRETLTIAALVQGGSLLGLLAYLSGISGLAGLGAVLMIVATWRVLQPLLEDEAANDNPIVARPLPPVMLPAFPVEC